MPRALLLIETPIHAPTSLRPLWVVLTITEYGGAWLRLASSPDPEPIGITHGRATRIAAPIAEAPAPGVLTSMRDALVKQVEHIDLHWRTHDVGSSNEARLWDEIVRDTILCITEHTPAYTHDIRHQSWIGTTRHSSHKAPDEPASTSSRIKAPHLILIILSLVIAIGLLKAPARPSVEHSGWIAHVPSGQAIPCRDAVADALGALHAREDAIRTTATTHIDPTGVFTHDPEPISWSALDAETRASPARVSIRARTGPSTWARGWLDPHSGAVRLVVGTNPDRGTVRSTLALQCARGVDRV